MAALFPVTFVFRLTGKLSPEKALVVERHCERKNSGTVAILAHAHHYACRAGAKCRMPRSDGQAAWRGRRCYDVREVHFDIRLTRLGEGVLGSDATFGETGRIDNVSIRRFGAFVNVFKNGPFKVGGEGRHIAAQRHSEVFTEVFQVLQRTNRAVYALVPRSKVRHVGTVNNDDPVLALRRSEAECGWEGGHALFLPYA